MAALTVTHCIKLLGQLGKKWMKKRRQTILIFIHLKWSSYNFNVVLHYHESITITFFFHFLSSFLFQLISDAGYQGEITSVSTASHQPEVFCERLKNLLCQVITTPPAELQDSFTALCVSINSMYSFISMFVFSCSSFLFHS